MPKVRIPKEKIICFNISWVYFLKDGAVYRGRRKSNRLGGVGSNESRASLHVLASSIEKVEWYCGKGTNVGIHSEETAKILQKYGVKIYGRKKEVELNGKRKMENYSIF